MDDTHTAVLLIALIVGVLLRTYLTFMQKVQNAKARQLRDPMESIPEYDHLFTGTAIASFFSALISALLLFPEAMGIMSPDLDYAGLFIFGVIYALGWNEVWNRYVSPMFLRK